MLVIQTMEFISYMVYKRYNDSVRSNKVNRFFADNSPILKKKKTLSRSIWDTDGSLLGPLTMKSLNLFIYRSLFWVPPSNSMNIRHVMYLYSWCCFWRVLILCVRISDTTYPCNIFLHFFLHARSHLDT